jgi:hypothetical protein
MLQRNYRNAQVEILLKVGYMSCVYSFIVADRDEAMLPVRALRSNASTTMALAYVF